MYKIGAFANLCQTSVQTLRYYERLGLLEPEHIDKHTSYRYYTLRQVEQVNRIMALKELGLSLGKIGELITKNISTEQIEIMLKSQRDEIERSIETEISRLRHIDFHIKLLEQENKMIDLDISIKPIEPIRVLSYKGSFNSDHEARELFATAMQTIKKAGVPLKYDYVMAISHQTFEHRLEDIEVAFPVEDDYEGEITVDEKYTFSTHIVPGTDSGITLSHKGLFEGEEGMQATVKLTNMWMAQNGYEPLTPVRISYLALMPDVEPEEQLRQIQIPVQKVESE